MTRILTLIFILFSLTYGNKYTEFSGKVTYYANHVLHKWNGVSNEINGFINYVNGGNEFSCGIKIPIASFDSKNASRDSNMLIYTNAIDFPDIVFSANDIEIIQNKAKVKGVLSFGGINRDIISDVDILITDNILFSGKIVIKLSDFKITRPSLLFKKIDDEIYIDFSITANKGN